MSLYPDAADQAYMARRIIDCCLREDIRGLVSQGRIAQLPEALSHKVVLPIATGGSIAHMLAVDYALKPVLAALKKKSNCR